MSCYKYANKKETSTNRNLREASASKRSYVDYDTIANEVCFIRDRLDSINSILEDISDLSISVQQELSDLEDAVIIIEDEI